VENHQPRAIVLDVMIPPPDGLEVCRRLRSGGWAGGVVIVSARSSPADREAATLAGVDRFLAKPFPLAELVFAVHALVNR
jgi:DNA-binding response OmpR family regulator